MGSVAGKSIQRNYVEPIDKMIGKYKYTGWPKKNATILITNFKETIE